MDNSEVLTCPACKGQMLFNPEDLKVKTPEKDDVAVCYYCAAALAFNADITLRLMTEKEISKLDEDIRNEMLEIQHYIAHATPIREH